MAWRLEEADRCQLCGTASWEWDENPHAYQPQEVWCKGCYLKDITTETKDNLPGTSIRMVPEAMSQE